MFLQVEHALTFEYAGYISESFLELRVQPKTTTSQTVASFELAVGPPTSVFRYRDWNDNLTHHFTITKFHDRIEVVARSLVQTHPAGPPVATLPDRLLPLSALPYPVRDFLDFGGPVRHTPALRTAHRAVGNGDRAPIGEQVRALGEYIQRTFEYRKDVTRYDSTTEDFMTLRAGVCQDFAHLMLGFLRLRGIPCRYVSGYLHVERTSREPSQSHAWIEFYAPSTGWVPFDPTHNVEVDERYVVVGHGRHYDDVPPNKGIYRGVAEETLAAQVTTRVTAGSGVSSLREEMRQIDLPVFSEIPQRRMERPTTAAQEAAAQQQQ